MNKLASRLEQTGAGAVLVRGTRAPMRPSRTVTVSPGVLATVDADRRYASLYVSADAGTGRAVRQFGYDEVPAAADCATRFVAERNAAALWLCGRDRFAGWWSESTVRGVERRLDEAARRAEVPLVVWTDDADRDAGANADRYDDVFEA
ncbi:MULTISPECIES: hypothetical protein [Halorussus]|uniref:hypothetical protein n=1 Tax=Halorussus TaxID=1070314 RepID=UPI00209CCAAF|nr:hypothetical protein [Halorussus vallis]USZ76925.1 hypothetical protein NGM07_06240 [Halorussus vallis]